MRRALVALVLLATAACAPAVKAGDETVRLDGGYVALGDSYTSAPGVPTEDGSACLRSDRNYPHLLAARLEVTSFADVSCAGATTQSLLTTQLAAIGPDTTLVTIGIGANDLGISGILLGACFQLAVSDPTGLPCRTQLGDQLQAAIGAAGQQVAAALGLVTQRAPQARIVLVGYPQLLPERGTCPELPYAEGDYVWLRSVFVTLDGTLSLAAREAGVDYLSLIGPSDGHDVCAGDDAWVQGIAADPAQAAALHPRLVGQQAVADLILAELS